MSSQFACRTCGADGQFSRHCVRERNFGSGEAFRYLECMQCGSLQIQEVPADLARHYPPDYLGTGGFPEPAAPASLRDRIRSFVRRQRTAYLLNGWNPIGWAADKRRRDDLALHLLALRHTGARRETRILDVGCGPGFLLHRLSQSGYEHLTGQDPFQQWTVPGIRVHTGHLEELPGQFDLIMLHHSLEHMPAPLRILVSLRKLLAPGGAVLVRIPLAASEAWAQYDVNWYQIDAPRHLVIPSRKGMEILAQRAGFGASLVEYDSDETQFLCSEQYRRGIPLRDARSYYRNPRQTLFSRAETADAKARAREANRTERGDQACFLLRLAA